MSSRWKSRHAARHKNRAESARKTIHHEIYETLNNMRAAGSGRNHHADKQAGVDGKYIYSTRTYNGYYETAKLFTGWCLENHPQVQCMQDCRQYTSEFIQAQIASGLSPYTIGTRKAALAKLYQMPQEERDGMPSAPMRRRMDITRSRGTAVRDNGISAATEAKYAALTSCTGLRRAELVRLHGTDLKTDGKGHYWLSITRGTKGGKSRKAPIIGTQAEVKALISACRTAGDAPICPRLPSHYDNHHYRAIYAVRAYRALARPVSAIPVNDRYIMRKDRAGVVLDRAAMVKVSKWLGHNRLDVIAGHYLYDL